MEYFSPIVIEWRIDIGFTFQIISHKIKGHKYSESFLGIHINKGHCCFSLFFRTYLVYNQ